MMQIGYLNRQMPNIIIGKLDKGEGKMNFRCHECYYYRRHYIGNTTWGECFLEPRYLAEFCYGKKVDGRKRACASFVFSPAYARYEHKEPQPAGANK